MKPSVKTVSGEGGIRLYADAWGDPSAPGVLMAHGGGQTRSAWGATGEALARRGWYVLSLDLRGHGDSEWAKDGDYRFEIFARDLIAVVENEFESPPVMVGASLGGIAGLLAQDLSDGTLFSSLVLVDITPRYSYAGVVKVVGFMKAHVEEGFESVEDAADAIAHYLPHRKRRPGDTEGLRKNLRLHSDGRYRWHWDPRFLDGKDPDQQGSVQERLTEAAKDLTIPTLLVRGRMSDVVTEEEARHFLEVAPHAEYVDVLDASHMVAGDKNDAFIDAVVSFIGEASEAA